MIPPNCLVKQVSRICSTITRAMIAYVTNNDLIIGRGELGAEHNGRWGNSALMGRSVCADIDLIESSVLRILVWWCSANPMWCNVGSFCVHTIHRRADMLCHNIWLRHPFSIAGLTFSIGMWLSNLLTVSLCICNIIIQTAPTIPHCQFHE